MRIKFLNDSINGWLQTLDRTANLHKQAHKGELSTTTAAQLTTTEGYGAKITGSALTTLQNKFNQYNKTAATYAMSGYSDDDFVDGRRNVNAGPGGTWKEKRSGRTITRHHSNHHHAVIDVAKYERKLLELISPDPDAVNLLQIFHKTDPTTTGSSSLVAPDLLTDLSGKPVLRNLDGSPTSRDDANRVGAFTAISFSGGGASLVFSATATNENSRTDVKTRSYEYQAGIAIELKSCAFVHCVGGLETGTGFAGSTDDADMSTTTTTSAVTRTFTLADPDVGDYFDVQVCLKA